MIPSSLPYPRPQALSPQMLVGDPPPPDPDLPVSNPPEAELANADGLAGPPNSDSGPPPARLTGLPTGMLRSVPASMPVALPDLLAADMAPRLPLLGALPLPLAWLPLEAALCPSPPTSPLAAGLTLALSLSSASSRASSWAGSVGRRMASPPLPPPPPLPAVEGDRGAGAAEDEECSSTGDPRDEYCTPLPTAACWCWCPEDAEEALPDRLPPPRWISPPAAMRSAAPGKEEALAECRMPPLPVPECAGEELPCPAAPCCSPEGTTLPETTEAGAEMGARLLLPPYGCRATRYNPPVDPPACAPCPPACAPCRSPSDYPSVIAAALVRSCRPLCTGGACV